MNSPHNVAVVIGSLRNNGYSSQLTRSLIAAAPSRLSLQVVGIGDLPLYNEDLVGNTPPSWKAFRDSIRSASAVLVVTPEYNRSTPAALKNAIDIGSRPYGHNVFDGKPVAIVSHSPGPLGGVLANHALRQSLVTLNMPTLQQPEAYISNVGALFDGEGTLTDDSMGKYFVAFMTAFAGWIDIHTLGDAARKLS